MIIFFTFPLQTSVTRLLHVTTPKDVTTALVKMDLKATEKTAHRRVRLCLARASSQRARRRRTYRKETTAKFVLFCFVTTVFVWFVICNVMYYYYSIACIYQLADCTLLIINYFTLNARVNGVRIRHISLRWVENIRSNLKVSWTLWNAAVKSIKRFQRHWKEF